MQSTQPTSPRPCAAQQCCRWARGTSRVHLHRLPPLLAPAGTNKSAALPSFTFFPVLLHSDETPGLLQAGQARPGSLSHSSQEGFPVPLALRRPCIAFSRAHPYLRGSEGPDPAAQLAAARLPSPPPREAPRPHLPPLLDASAPPAAAAALPPAVPPPSSRMRTTSLAPLAPATPLPSPRGSETALTGRSAQAQKAGPRRRSVSLSPRPPRRMRGLAAPAFLARAPSPRPRAGAERCRRGRVARSVGGGRFLSAAGGGGGGRSRRRAEPPAWPDPVRPAASGAPRSPPPVPALPSPGRRRQQQRPPPRPAPSRRRPPRPSRAAELRCPRTSSLCSAPTSTSSPPSPSTPRVSGAVGAGLGGGGVTAGRAELRCSPPRGCSAPAPGPLGPPAFLARPRPPQECVPTGSARGGGGGLAARPGMRMGLAGPAAGNGAAGGAERGFGAGGAAASGVCGGTKAATAAPVIEKAVTSLGWVK